MLSDPHFDVNAPIIRMFHGMLVLKGWNWHLCDNSFLHQAPLQVFVKPSNKNECIVIAYVVHVHGSKLDFQTQLAQCLLKNKRSDWASANAIYWPTTSASFADPLETTLFGQL